MYILGVSALYHDSAAALCRDGEIVAAAQEERFTRIKHDASVPVNAIRYCLDEAGIAPSALDAVVYYDNPLLTLDRWTNTVLAYGEECRGMMERSIEPLFGQKLWIHRLLGQALGDGPCGPLLTVKHHISHAASAFYPSPFREAAVLTLDGVGEWTTTGIGMGKDENIELLREIEYPHSLGLLYGAFTYFCGFKVNSGDYKLMGLAPYGNPKYCGIIRDKLMDLRRDGSFRMNMEYFDYQRNAVMTNDAFAELFGGPPREPESPITRREMDMAASVQRVLEEAVVRLGREAARSTGAKNLVMAGGVALNCVANGLLLRENVFDGIWIQPAAGDAGGALGAALYAAHSHFKIPRRHSGRDSQRGSRLGPSFDETAISADLADLGAVFHRYEDKASLYADVAAHLSRNMIVGFFNGRMEFGPRALGARSILADPRSLDMQSRLNLKIKYRESFRPFAPSVLAERAEEYFDLAVESPYMLLCADVRKERRREFDLPRVGDLDMIPFINQPRSDIPAVTHVDFSARVQTVNELDDPDYHRLLTEFEKITGCAVLANTSFNVRGEPIVCTPLDAYRCFMRTGIDILVMENVLCMKNEQPAFEDAGDWRNQYALD